MAGKRYQRDDESFGIMLNIPEYSKDAYNRAVQFESIEDRRGRANQSISSRTI